MSPNLSPKNKNNMGDMCKILDTKWPTFHNSFFTIKDFGCQVALCTNFARLRNIYHSCGRFIFYCHAQIANGTNTSLFHQDIFTFQVSEIGKKDCYNTKANCKKGISCLSGLFRSPLESVHDFLIKLDMKPCMHLVEIS